MREILFRGKSVDNDKWIYGFLIQMLDENNTLKTSCIVENMSSFDIVTGKLKQDYWKVDFETIGQYTGLCDKNGTKIFEGDIVEFETNINCITSELKPYWKDCIEKQYAVGGGTWWVRKEQAVVQWNSKDGMWDLKVYNNGRYKRKSKLFTYRESDYIVVGNIHDNPELLGSDTNVGGKLPL